MNFIEFLGNGGPDAKGRNLGDYLAFAPEKWEDCHDHMQWAFPTRTASAFNPNAPIVPEEFYLHDSWHDTDEQNKFNCTVQENMLLLLRAYLDSVNIEMWFDDTKGYQFRWKGDYFLHWNDWLYKGNHNLLRMTRVLESLNIFEMDDIAEGLHDFLVFHVATHFDVGSKTVAFWVAAKENRLRLVR